MSRIFLLLAIVLLVVIIYRSLRNRKVKNTLATKKLIPKKMVRCDYCGLFIPKHESLDTEDGHHYCSQEHKRLGNPET